MLLQGGPTGSPSSTVQSKAMVTRIVEEEDGGDWDSRLGCDKRCKTFSEQVAHAITKSLEHSQIWSMGTQTGSTSHSHWVEDSSMGTHTGSTSHSHWVEDSSMGTHTGSTSLS